MMSLVPRHGVSVVETSRCARDFFSQPTVHYVSHTLTLDSICQATAVGVVRVNYKHLVMIIIHQ